MSRREGWRAVRNRANASINEALAAVAEVKAAEEAERKERVAAIRQAEAERVRFTAADLAGAEVVRDYFGWHTVVRVSAKSVTVRTPYSWTERIPVDKVLEFRRAAS